MSYKEDKAIFMYEVERVRSIQSISLTDEASIGFKQGYKAGLTAFAWWKDGSLHVGTCGTTLKHALEEVEKEED